MEVGRIFQVRQIFHNTGTVPFGVLAHILEAVAFVVRYLFE